MRSIGSVRQHRPCSPTSSARSLLLIFILNSRWALYHTTQHPERVSDCRLTPRIMTDPAGNGGGEAGSRSRELVFRHTESGGPAPRASKDCPPPFKTLCDVPGLHYSSHVARRIAVCDRRQPPTTLVFANFSYCMYLHSSIAVPQRL